MRCILFLSALCCATWETTAKADDDKDKTQPVNLSDNQIHLQAPAAWKKVKPRVNFIDYEFSVSPAEGDKTPVRITMMGAGGSIEQNIDRWKGQFSKTTDSKVTKQELGGQVVHIVDITGTYRDSSGGPFARGATKMRDDYRMLAAIIVTKDKGNYFIKAYGPKKTVASIDKPFQKMLKSLEVD